MRIWVYLRFQKTCKMAIEIFFQVLVTKKVHPRDITKSKLFWHKKNIFALMAVADKRGLG